MHNSSAIGKRQPKEKDLRIRLLQKIRRIKSKIKSSEVTTMDITMCISEKCPKKNECYRANGKQNPLWQSYSNFDVTCLENDSFIYFMEIYENSSKGDV